MYLLLFAAAAAVADWCLGDKYLRCAKLSLIMPCAWLRVFGGTMANRTTKRPTRSSVELKLPEKI